jgi:hypothetical protein
MMATVHTARLCAPDGAHPHVTPQSRMGMRGFAGVADYGVADEMGKITFVEQMKDRTWLAKVTNTLNQHWQKRNAAKKNCQANGQGLIELKPAVND